jgi:hypothetical protein
VAELGVRPPNVLGDFVAPVNYARRDQDPACRKNPVAAEL